MATGAAMGYVEYRKHHHVHQSSVRDSSQRHQSCRFLLHLRNISRSANLDDRLRVVQFHMAAVRGSGQISY